MDNIKCRSLGPVHCMASSGTSSMSSEKRWRITSALSREKARWHGRQLTIGESSLQPLLSQSCQRGSGQTVCPFVKPRIYPEAHIGLQVEGCPLLLPLLHQSLRVLQQLLRIVDQAAQHTCNTFIHSKHFRALGGHSARNCKLLQSIWL